MEGHREAERSGRRHLAEAVGGYAAFCAISYASRFFSFALPLMVVSGIALPLVWARATGDWTTLGFTRRRLGAAVGWGLAAGVVTGLLGLAVLHEPALPPELGRELAVAIPLWLLAASPFQEFFFRGWLQPRFESSLGTAPGLLAATTAFTLWHYCWPLAAGSSVPLYTLTGLTATFGAGLVYGYSFQRSGNIVAPWLAHAFSGIVLVAAGAASFLTALP